MDDPKTQKLIEKALKAQRKAIVDAIKDAVGGLVEQAKVNGEKPITKAVKEALASALDAAKNAEA